MTILDSQGLIESWMMWFEVTVSITASQAILFPEFIIIFSKVVKRLASHSNIAVSVFSKHSLSQNKTKLTSGSSTQNASQCCLGPAASTQKLKKIAVTYHAPCAVSLVAACACSIWRDHMNGDTLSVLSLKILPVVFHFRVWGNRGRNTIRRQVSHFSLSVWVVTIVGCIHSTFRKMVVVMGRWWWWWHTGVKCTTTLPPSHSLSICWWCKRHHVA